MARRMIRTGDDPVLRQIAKPVPQMTNALRKLLDDMAETMYAADGIGLAANQVGIAKRLVVVDIGEGGPGLMELVNPEIFERQGSQVSSEGCLSLPGLRGDVERAKFIRVRAYDRYLQPFEFEAVDLLARCVQHEVDHLDGILFTDHVLPGQLRHEVESKSRSRVESKGR
ncbi:MAG: peptide deformylase [Alicyclobacillaceae bacterium]|jgi:peptide deformylase|uniref:peptide deformylase n=1 Tax=Alicyclobacillus sp. SP_1 TaxID=2942475 RepID=UPI00215845B5|nr:peptide deformylase [Alicyclobacillus sp. SP_1]MCY0895867.1 peptide deformylase [Alicyclobacillaceae bacterium]